jgi:uncharacterized membrane protein
LCKAWGNVTMTQLCLKVVTNSGVKNEYYAFFTHILSKYYTAVTFIMVVWCVILYPVRVYFGYFLHHNFQAWNVLLKEHGSYMS